MLSLMLLPTHNHVLSMPPVANC
uniref:Uncharacterized protein n=1 Tax=Arundo donax TaxID=35708 RepID=A0A0A8ZSS0_ARUDO